MSTRKEILEMLSAGQIDVDEATRLLGAVPEDPPAQLPPAAPARQTPATPAPDQGGRRWLHIQVSDLNTGKDRVRVNVPLGLLKFGLKIGARFTDEVDDELMHNVAAAIEDPSISGTLVEVEDVEDGERVHIYVD